MGETSNHRCFTYKVLKVKWKFIPYSSVKKKGRVPNMTARVLYLFLFILKISKGLYYFLYRFSKVETG